MYLDIIEFWFNEIDQFQWWRKDEIFDELIRTRFLGIHRQAILCELYPWRSSALGRLSEIIVLDQFSRNMYRGKPESFSSDSLALALAQSVISDGCASELEPEQRRFLYMPFMHSESLLIHKEAVKLFTDLGLELTLAFEMKHKSIIEQFGRYPHRNEILGRKSTPEEIEFLSKPGSSF